MFISDNKYPVSGTAGQEAEGLCRSEAPRQEAEPGDTPHLKPTAHEHEEIIGKHGQSTDIT